MYFIFRGRMDYICGVKRAKSSVSQNPELSVLSDGLSPAADSLVLRHDVYLPAQCGTAPAVFFKKRGPSVLFQNLREAKKT